jgi:hypothetical protein
MGPETFLVKIVKRLLTPCQHGFTVALHVGGANEMTATEISAKAARLVSKQSTLALVEILSFF